MKLFNFNTAYSHLRELYGIELQPDEFETLGMVAWTKIGNKLTELKTIELPVNNFIVDLPCEIDEIESVYLSTSDYQRTSNKEYSPLYENQYIESYIESRKYNNDDFYKSGTFIKYHVIDDRKIKVSFESGMIKICYKTILLDEDDLPKLNLKEIDAIAAYCAYSINFKKSLMTKDQATLQISQLLKQEWQRLCDHARTPESMSQNDFDAIGDVKYSWDRKTYGKTFKPIR